MSNKDFIESVARICHEVNKAYCAAHGDFTHLHWEQAPDWAKESARVGVKFHLDNPEAGPSGSHESWLKQKEAEGWKYGAFKDPVNKLHPCFVPYAQLDVVQRAKDYIFTAIVKSIAQEQAS